MKANWGSFSLFQFEVSNKKKKQEYSFVHSTVTNELTVTIFDGNSENFRQNSSAPKSPNLRAKGRREEEQLGSLRMDDARK